MKTMPSCILYSSDDELSGRLTRIASSIAALHPIGTQPELEQWIAQFGETVLVADLRAPNCLDVLASIKETAPETVIIAMGSSRSDPMLAAEWMAPFSTTNLTPDRREFQALLKQAVECLQLRKKNQLLQDELNKLSARQNAPKEQPRTLFSEPLQNFSKAQRNFDNLDMLFDSVVEGLVATARVSRAGIFMKPGAEEKYVYQAGTRCLATTQNLSFLSIDPFVRWLEMHTHLISRQTLKNIPDPEDRAMLKFMLDSLGAEIIIPLYASGHIKGWIFVGQRATGIPFELADLEDLTGLADHISTTLEKALQYEETALQKALAETLLHSIPFGIIACDEHGTVRWFNNTAMEILQTGDTIVIGQPAEALDSRIADMLYRAIGDQKNHDIREWSDLRTKLTLSAETRCLLDNGSCVGAMMMLRDVTGARLLKEKEDQLERAAFWNELASSMSHEIRNPLVAIKTFSQLLPERYEDAEFRAEFSEQVTAEVDQLNHIIDKINEFANPPKPAYHPLDVRKPIEHAVTRIQAEFDHENLKIHLSSDETAMQINGDATSLEECIYHLLRNSAENLNNKSGARINVIVKNRNPENSPPTIYLIITDNGSGIDASVQGKVYSPFSTIKARGLGLGLPIAKRAVIDHNGQMDIETSSGGTSITIALPAIGKTQE
jgi:signal transduction histidine kinase